ncbi:MAG: hypothetical protein FJ284_15390 [Planctomycetes bacterium]|nr:hypothetical protein [Planctomycetota bacterium]
MIDGPIARGRTLGKATTWVIAGQARVRCGVTLKITDGAMLLIVNGVLPKSQLRRAALSCEPGSAFVAGRFTVRACNGEQGPVRVGSRPMRTSTR